MEFTSQGQACFRSFISLGLGDGSHIKLHKDYRVRNVGHFP